MSVWSRPLEVNRLAEMRAEVDFCGALAELARLGSLPGAVTGSVRGTARFAREQGFAVVDLAVRGSATLECQRCLQPMELPIDSSTRIALIASEGEATRVPGELEPVLARSGRISVGELVEEELLLTLPIVPLHGSEAACAGASAGVPHSRGSETHRPFADLPSLLKR